jgi:hypothetical protein
MSGTGALLVAHVTDVSLIVKGKDFLILLLVDYQSLSHTCMFIEVSSQVSCKRVHIVKPNQYYKGTAIMILIKLW